MDALTTILKIAPQLHSAGTMSLAALDALVHHAKQRKIRASAETGCGASTLLLSHLSERHTVFALDGGSGSVVNVRQSPLLNPGIVTFVEGPSQATLPRHQFESTLQLVLLDGPHAYPFPDLEYYFLYPHLDAGALLVVDDIQIRTIHNLFEFLRRDAMFQLEGVVRTTAFFTRTSAPTFDPLGEGWWEQGYNSSPVWRYAWRDRLGAALPRSWRAAVLRRRRTRRLPGGSGTVEIETPVAGSAVSERGNVAGSARVQTGARLVLLAHRKDIDGWWLQAGGPVETVGERWSVEVRYGISEDAGAAFEIAAIVVDVAGALGAEWLARISQQAGGGPIPLPPAEAVLAEEYRTVRKMS